MAVPNVRQQVRQQEDQAIQTNIAKIEEAKARPTALSALASRLNISSKNLETTLRATVFKNSSDSEFAALVVVANEYGLNPLTKEIYAFPQKGGGIVPLVSIDGWIRIMNNHPQFDGIEFTDIPDDNGKLYAIEAVIYRKDRTRPIRVTEYLEECKRETDPWKKSPARMLRHRSLIQCARIAFGFSGIYDADDEVVGEISLSADRGPPPMRQANVRRIEASEASDGTVYDPQTGEVFEPEGPADSQRGEQHLDAAGREIDPQQAKAEDIIDRAGKVETVIDLKSLRDESAPHIDAMSDEEMAGACNRALADAEKRLKAGK